MPAKPGTTHCGKWTNRTPKGVYVTRLVCTLPPGHEGRHYNRWLRRYWRNEAT